jgi:hypothetical protein
MGAAARAECVLAEQPATTTADVEEAVEARR